MARGLSPGPSPLPKVSFSKVQDDFASYPSGVHDQQMRSFGYNDFSEFKRPEHYIRYIEPLESELAEQVEYDMDEQDQEWLDAVNSERKRDGHGAVSYELFEIIMDRLEKEWLDLTKNIPKPDLALPSEDSTCAICDDSEGENTNAIVFCDGCNLAVHQDCYGVPYIPEGQWLCRKCTVSPENPVSCVLCPNEGGAFKQTAHGDWVHLLCAIWVPETRVANDVFMEPITGIDRISKQRWRLKCSLCDVKEGACIQCNKPSCFVAFHVTCARKEKFLMPMKASQGSEAPMLAAFCEKHLPQEQQDAREAAHEAERTEAVAFDNKNLSPKSNKTARAYAKTYKPGPPLVPRIIIERILQYISKVGVRHKREFVVLVCKYWSLKREARRGAAFLKRLHLEPWTANTGSYTDEEKAIKLEYMKRLRRDLESIRMIAEMCRKRESQKLNRVETIQYVFDKLLLTHEPVLRHAFERITATDRMDIFRAPVSLENVPDYLEIVELPMSWSVIDGKLNGHQYLDLQEFKDDIKLVATNAMLYNKPGTAYHKTAQKVLGAAEPIMAELDKLISRPPTDERTVDDSPDAMEEDGLPPTPPRAAVGDLEPPIDLLDLLLSEKTLQDDIDLVLDKPPLDALFSYELPKQKPPPPEPEPQLGRPKIGRKAQLERKRRERLDASPGFRALRSQRSSASMAQSESEAPEWRADEPEAGSSAHAPEPEVPTEQPTTPARRGRPRKKHVIAEPGKLAAETVEEVDNQQSFKMFDMGWILSPDQVRGGRQRPAPQPTPTKKKGRGARGKSHLAGLATGPADNETLDVVGHPEQAPSVEAFTEHVPQVTTAPADDAQTSPTLSGDPGLVEGGADAATSLDRSESQLPPTANQTNVEMSAAQTSPGNPSLPDEGVPEVSLESTITGEAHVDLATLAEVSTSNEDDRVMSGVDGVGAEAETLEEVSQAVQIAEEDRVEAASIRQEIVADPTGYRVLEADITREPGGAAEPSVVEADATRKGEGFADDDPTEERPTAIRVGETVETDTLAAKSPVATSSGLPRELQGGPPQTTAIEEPAGAATSSDERMDIDRPIPMDDLRPDAHGTPEAENAGGEKPDEEPVRIIIIEHLDTPAIRKQKYLQKRAEKERKKAEAAAAAEAERMATTAAASAKAGPSHQAQEDSKSDLSDLSDLTDADDDNPSAGANRADGEETEPGAVVLAEGELLEGGTLVWAKADTFPWWPAVVFEPDDPAIPKRILSWSTRIEKDVAGPLHIVQFFDSKNTWQCLRPDRMRLLGEDHALDQDMLAGVSKMQKWKTPKLRQQCREAFRRAMAERETEEEESPLAKTLAVGSGMVMGSG